MPSLTVQLITVSIITLQRQLQHNEYASRNQWNDVYNYIVVGAGTAGATLASRLAENNTNINVLLLEAGIPQSEITDMPGAAGTLVGSEFDWYFPMEPQPHASLGFVNQSTIQSKGRVIGGTSTINWMIYNRGNRRVFDSWASEYGATGWSYCDVMPYFLRAENNTDRRVVERNPAFHATGGPWAVSSVDPDPILLKWQENVNTQGYPTVDINGPTQSGTFIYQFSTKNGTRASTGNAYLERFGNRSNLHVVARAYVTKILINNTSNGLMAHGVEFTRNGRNYMVHARNEVIISAGTIKTPQLLMLSGIGPREQLESFNIQVLADLPVGENFQDHVFTHFPFFLTNQSLALPSPDINVQNMYDYYVHQTGPLTQIPNSITYHSTRNNDNEEYPNTVINMNSEYVGTNISQIVAPFNESLRNDWAEFWKPYLGKAYLLVTTALYRPRSVGYVRLSSTNPYDNPLINPRFLTNPHDTEALVDIMRTALELADNKYFSQYAQIFPTPFPGCIPCPVGNPFRCDQYLRCVARMYTMTALHPGGACRMGNSSDPHAVVDQDLRVIGVDRLRVVDSSVMPVLVNSNNNAATNMIGEYASDIIINYYRRTNSY